ncbi:MAG: F0F1 ATP synthase subunit B [Nitrospiraceae bacterium]|nr:F0F1 ATP synthase subunit B [Nitrospiraceae bacterium]
MKAANKIKALAFFWMMLVPAQAALAADATGSVYSVKGWILQIVNFVIFITVIVWLTKKPLAKYLKARTEGIAKSVEEARKARETAEKALREVEERLRLKDAELEEILRTAKKSGEAEREALVQEAERMSRKIAEHADAYLSFELKNAKDAIRKEAAELAVGLAEKKLSEKMTPGEQKKLLDEAISHLEAKS